ncbi:MAG: hypothetical protein RI900_949 [Actinomycetota bacterium]
MVAAFGLGQLFLLLIYMFLFITWFTLLWQIWVDIFRDREMGGIARVLWLAFTIIAPFLGAFVYLLSRGKKMAENQVQAAQAQQDAVRGFIRQAAGTSGVEELHRLVELRDKGEISAEEYATLKARIVS